MARVLGPYELQDRLGKGGMAEVYVALQKNLGRKVALKLLNRRLAGDEMYIARFEAEARKASSLRHLNILTVFDFGVADGEYYIAMELMDGPSLLAAVEQTGTPIPPALTLVLLEEIAAGLEAAHEAGIIHRDIKPANILLGLHGEVKVADFGLAREEAPGAGHQDLTVPGSILGTPGYMSPEQWTRPSRELDRRADVFSLGVLAFELLVGSKPFHGRDQYEFRESILRKNPAPFESKWPLPDDSVERMVLRMLEKDRDKRFASMAEVRKAAEQCQDVVDEDGVVTRRRRAQLEAFARDPAEFCAVFRDASVFKHMGRAQDYQRMGLSKIDDAIREYEAVIRLSPDHPVAAKEVKRLLRKKQDSEEIKAGAQGTKVLPNRAKRPPPGEDTEVRVASSRRRWAWLVVPVIAGAAALAYFGPWNHRVRNVPLVQPPGTGAPAATAPAAPAAHGDAHARLEVRSTPDGAAVSFRRSGDATFQERAAAAVTPAVVDSLDPGRWEFRVAAAGFVAADSTLDLPAGYRGALAVELVRCGRLHVRTEPKGAGVVLHDAADHRTELGQSPATTELIAPGDYVVGAELAGYVPEGRPVRVRSGVVDTLVIALNPLQGAPPPAPRDGYVRVSVTPAASLVVDGGSARPTAASHFLSLPAGPHRLELKAEDIRGSHAWTQTIAAGDTAVVEHRFLTGTLRVSSDPTLPFHVHVDDGPAVGETPVFQMDVAAGTHLVRLTRAGWSLQSAMEKSPAHDWADVAIRPDSRVSVVIPASGAVTLRFRFSQS